MCALRKYSGDDRTYLVTKIRGTKKYQAHCKNSFEENGIRYYCYFSAREDVLKKSIAKNILHNCADYKEPKHSHNKTIDSFFKDPVQVTIDNWTPEALAKKLVVFIARKNISMNVGTSDEM